jgi:hypothetical protein
MKIQTLIICTLIASYSHFQSAVPEIFPIFPGVAMENFTYQRNFKMAKVKDGLSSHHLNHKNVVFKKNRLMKINNVKQKLI